MDLNTRKSVFGVSNQVGLKLACSARESQNIEFSNVASLGQSKWALPLEDLSWGVCEHQHSLISAFAIHLLESIISRLATSEISIF